MATKGRNNTKMPITPRLNISKSKSVKSFKEHTKQPWGKLINNNNESQKHKNLSTWTSRPLNYLKLSLSLIFEAIHKMSQKYSNNTKGA